MKIAVRRGHQRTGKDGAANGYVKEIDVAERYYKLVIQKFRALGHQVLDVTPSEANRTLSDSLNYGIDKANNWGADYLISCHANAFEEDVARGCEVVCGSNNGITVGQRIVNEFVKLGIPIHQGAYKDVRGLAEIKNFKGITLICEPFFCDSKLDVAIYNRVGAEGIANAIVTGIVGQSNINNTIIKEEKIIMNDFTAAQKARQQTFKVPDNNNVVPEGDNITKLNGGGWIERHKDGRVITHLSRVTYYSLHSNGQMTLTHCGETRNI